MSMNDEDLVSTFGIPVNDELILQHFKETTVQLVSKGLDIEITGSKQPYQVSKVAKSITLAIPELPIDLSDNTQSKMLIKYIHQVQSYLRKRHAASTSANTKPFSSRSTSTVAAKSRKSQATATTTNSRSTETMDLPVNNKVVQISVLGSERVSVGAVAPEGVEVPMNTAITREELVQQYAPLYFQSLGLSGCEALQDDPKELEELSGTFDAFLGDHSLLGPVTDQFERPFSQWSDYADQIPAGSSNVAGLNPTTSLPLESGQQQPDGDEEQAMQTDEEEASGSELLSTEESAYEPDSEGMRESPMPDQRQTSTATVIKEESDSDDKLFTEDEVDENENENGNKVNSGEIDQLLGAWTVVAAGSPSGGPSGLEVGVKEKTAADRTVDRTTKATLQAPLQPPSILYRVLRRTNLRHLVPHLYAFGFTTEETVLDVTRRSKDVITRIMQGFQKEHNQAVTAGTHASGNAPPIGRSRSGGPHVSVKEEVKEAHVKRKENFKGKGKEIHEIGHKVTGLQTMMLVEAFIAYPVKEKRKKAEFRAHAHEVIEIDSD